MKKFRLVGSGNPDFPYKIQVKRMLFWHDYCYWDTHAGDFISVEFSDLYEAEEYLSSLQTEIYCGKEI